MKEFLMQLINEENINFKNINLNENDIEILIKQLNNMKEDFLYKSKFHGLYHSEKVLLFSYLLGKNQGLNDEQMQIIMDAAVYHDIGRIADNEDEQHGLVSSNRLIKEKNNILSNPIYKDDANFSYLRLICDAHSRHDKYDKLTFENYVYDNEVTNINFETFKKLSDILKDADALDRTRFMNVTSAVLDEKYLRHDYSKKLIPFAKYINELYRMRDLDLAYPLLNSEYGRQKDKIDNESCFHGVGSDFFKLESILNNGILSAYSRKKQNLNVSSNFYGSNGSLWISVVDASMVSQNGDAYRRYIQKGISLYCHVQKFKEDNTNNISGYADTKNKNEYIDEKYVFDRIEVEQIHSIFIPNEMVEKDVSELNYMICASVYNNINDTVNYYKNEMKKRGFFSIDDAQVNKLLQIFINNALAFDELSPNDQIRNRDSYSAECDIIKEKINIEVQKWFKNFYSYILKKDLNEKITVLDVVMHLMEKFNYSKCIPSKATESETIIIINPLFSKDENVEAKEK